MVSRSVLLTTLLPACFTLKGKRKLNLRSVCRPWSRERWTSWRTGATRQWVSHKPSHNSFCCKFDVLTLVFLFCLQTYSQLAHPIQQAKAMGLQFHSKILDIDNIDVRTIGKTHNIHLLHPNGPVTPSEHPDGRIMQNNGISERLNFIMTSSSSSPDVWSNLFRLFFSL